MNAIAGGAAITSRAPSRDDVLGAERATEAGVGSASQCHRVSSLLGLLTFTRNIRNRRHTLIGDFFMLGGDLIFFRCLIRLLLLFDQLLPYRFALLILERHGLHRRSVKQGN